MIIHALHRYYQILAAGPDAPVPPVGYSIGKVMFAFNLSESGELLDVIPLYKQEGNRARPRQMVVPEQKKNRAAGITPNFLCDNSTYILGADRKGNPKRTRRAFKASQELHLKVLSNLDDLGARAVCNYFQSWSPEKAGEHPALSDFYEEAIDGGNIVFRLDGQEGYIHERPAIKGAWEEYKRKNASRVVGQCLISGRPARIARIHPNIQGVRGAQSSGASLVSFNISAFESYGKTQSFNAPVSEEVAFGYTTALNYLLQNPRHHLQVDPNTTMVFWAERKGGLEENLLAELLHPSRQGDGKKKSGSIVDHETAQLVNDVLDRVRNGLPVTFNSSRVDKNVRFHILGLSPNSSRLSVRFWQVNSFGTFVERVANHFRDLEIVGSRRNGSTGLIAISDILKETAPLGDYNRIPPLLSGALTRSILEGKQYPQGLYTAIISRIRADQKVNHVRAAVLKACLLRKWRIRFSGSGKHRSDKEVTLTVTLNEANPSKAYRLGRLFAVLEKVQQDATPGLNATIRDRFFASASSTPRAVFPQLLRLTQHHIAKAEYGRVYDKKIEEIVNGLDKFPSHLNLEEQGEFMLGYYQQRQAFYEKTDKKEG